jgi:hypothetical protein
MESITGRLIGVYRDSVTAASEVSTYYELEADRRLYVKYYGQANRHVCTQGKWQCNMRLHIKHYG